MHDAAIVFDVITVVLFTAAFAVVIATPASSHGILSAGAKWFGGAAFGVYVFGAGVDALSGFMRLPVLSIFENYTELLFFPLMLYATQLVYDRQQLEDARSNAHSMKASRELTMKVIDTVPAGIFVVDEAGRITFANETAREVLDLVDDDEAGTMVTPGWQVCLDGGECSDDFSVVIACGRRCNLPATVEWPGGRWRVALSLSVSRLDGGVGTIVAFPMPKRAVASA